MNTRLLIENFIEKIANKLLGDLDGDFLEAYRKLLFAQYRSLNNAVRDQRASQEAQAVIALGENAKWEDLYNLELALVKLEPFELLSRRAWILREEYKEIASPVEIVDYYASKPPSSDDLSHEAMLRADCVRLQEEVSWRYIVIWALQGFRAKLTRRVLRWTGAFLVFALLLCSPTVTAWFRALGLNLNLPFLALVVLPGIIGGLISTVRRIQTVPLDGNADLALTQLDEGNASVILSPFLGGVFAFVLFCLMAGGFLNGNLFPTLGFENFWGDLSDKIDSGEIPKLIIWSFIAGFFERFVPDRLEQLAQGASDKPAISPPSLPPSSTSFLTTPSGPLPTPPAKLNIPVISTSAVPAAPANILSNEPKKP